MNLADCLRCLCPSGSGSGGDGSGGSGGGTTPNCDCFDALPGGFAQAAITVLTHTCVHPNPAFCPGGDDLVALLDGKVFITSVALGPPPQNCDCYLFGLSCHTDPAIDLCQSFIDYFAPSTTVVSGSFVSYGATAGALCTPTTLGAAIDVNVSGAVNQFLFFIGTYAESGFPGTIVQVDEGEPALASFHCDPFELVFDVNFSMIVDSGGGQAVVETGRLRYTCTEYVP